MPIYEQISSNKWKSFFLFVFFFIFISIVAYLFSVITGFGAFGLAFAVILALGLAFFSYYNSDKIVLAISKARPVTKKEFPYLYNTIQGLAIAAGLPEPKMYVIDDSAPNAFATGRNPENAAICVTTGLLKKLNRLELEGVIAHEISHIKNYDIRTMTLAVVMVGIVVLLSDMILRSFFWGAHRRDSDRLSIVLIVIGLALALLAPLVATLIKLAISRKREFLADASGALLTRYPEGLASALEKISEDTKMLQSATKATAHLYIENPLRKQKSFLNNLFSTHPPVEERIKALRAM